MRMIDRIAEVALKLKGAGEQPPASISMSPGRWGRLELAMALVGEGESLPDFIQGIKIETSKHMPDDIALMMDKDGNIVGRVKFE